MLSDRSKALRLKAMDLMLANGGYHYGGTFSCAEILITLYDRVLEANDRFILSKGHGCWIYYALLLERGLRPKLHSHPHLDLAHGVHWTTGSEGHGMPAGIGMALAKKMKGESGRVFVLIGDGECQEGTTWESLLLARQLNLGNLVVVVDMNQGQGSGAVVDVLTHTVSVVDAAASVGWWVVSQADGHDIEMLSTVFNTRPIWKPMMVFARTTKGKGISFMEGDFSWHAKWPSKEQQEQMRKELS